MSTELAKQKVTVHIRWMIRRDMPEVMAIELDSFCQNWNEEDFLRVLRQRNCIGMVAELGDKVVGFMIYELHKHSLNIINFAVAPELRRQSVGRQMLDKLISKLSNHRRVKITLDIRETNLSAQLFFGAMHLKAVKVKRSWYEDTGEDAYMMQYSLPGASGVELSDEDDDSKPYASDADEPPNECGVE